MKKNIILVQPENGLNETTYAPLGLISLAAYVRNNFGVKIIDLRMNSIKKLIDATKSNKPLAVAFTMLTGSCILQIIYAAKRIKKIDPKIKIIVGGIHPTFFPEQSLSNSDIDFVIVNEGEKSLLALLSALRDGGGISGIPGVGFKIASGQIIVGKCEENFVNMDDLPMPAWDLIDVERYIKNLSRNPGERVINFYTSKGCPFPCGFCYNLNFNKRKWRCRSAERAFEELKFLHKKYGINYFIIHDDNFVVDRERALKFAELIINSGLKIKYSIDARVDYFEYDFFKKLKEGGMDEIRVGCESGSDRILKEVIQKGIKVEQTLKAIEVAKKLDLKLILSFVIGWPTETVEERQMTIDLIIKIQKIYKKAAVYPLWIYIPYAGTPLFEKALELGFEVPKTLEEWGSYFWGKAHIPWLKNKEEHELIHELSPFAWYSKSINSLQNKSLKNLLRHLLIKIFRPFVLFRFRHNFWRFPLEAKTITYLKRFYQKSIKSYDKFLAGELK